AYPAEDDRNFITWRILDLGLFSKDYVRADLDFSAQARNGRRRMGADPRTPASCAGLTPILLEAAPAEDRHDRSRGSPP
ncbi:hypothetical protein ACIKTA_15200, partial [Hansschlegelia beijingensis]